MTTMATEIRGWLRQSRADIVEFLRELVEHESPSGDRQALDDIRELLAGALEDLGYRIRRPGGHRATGHLYASPARGEPRLPRQLILGHYDTVWPKGSLAGMPFGHEGNVVQGPGVYDMKGGLCCAIFALRALRAVRVLPDIMPVLFFNSDEEIGSRGSRRYIERLARRVERVFVLEPALGQSGKLKTARKGVGRFEIVAKGRAAHAGLDPAAGASAILEMSHAIQALFALNDPDRGVTVNVGTVDGGLRPNVIAPESRAHVDVRVLTRDDAVAVEAAIKGLKPVTPGVILEVYGGIGRPPMEPTPRNQALWRLAESIAREMDIELEQGTAGGGSDGNYTSEFAATLDGLGAVGDGAHAHHECLFLDQTIDRMALLALLLASPSRCKQNPVEKDRRGHRIAARQITATA